MAKNLPLIVKLNQNSMNNSKVHIKNKDGFVFLNNTDKYFDVILIDLPDPRTVELGRLYSRELYSLAYKHLRPGGIVVTQAGSPYFATRAFKCIVKTMKKAGFVTIPLHNDILSLGEWGWSFGIKQDTIYPLLDKMRNLKIKVETKWINTDAMKLITSFGKNIFPNQTDSVEVNTIQNPVLYRYYLKGNWDLY